MTRFDHACMNRSHCHFVYAFAFHFVSIDQLRFKIAVFPAIPQIRQFCFILADSFKTDRFQAGVALGQYGKLFCYFPFKPMGLRTYGCYGMVTAALYFL